MNIIEANRKHIEAALEYSGGTHNFEDVEKAINDGIMQLWPASNSAAVTEIIQYAKENQVDLIVAGSRGLTSMQSWLLGSVSRKLVHYAGCSVLIVKGPHRIKD